MTNKIFALAQKDPVSLALYTFGGAVAVYFTVLFLSAPRVATQSAGMMVTASVQIVLAAFIVIVIGMVQKPPNYAKLFTLRCTGKCLLVLSPALIMAGYTVYAFIVALNAPDAILNEYTQGQIINLALISISSAIFEEVLFRALFISVILSVWSKSSMGRLGVIVFSAVIVILLNPGGSLAVFALAAIYASAYMFSKNIVICTVVHIIINLTQRIPILVFGEDFAATPAYVSLAIVIVVCVIAMFVFAILFTVKAKPFELTFGRGKH
ncbi:MAG: CPBP family intramembrane metalloprotease [Defluviitaleaceae bacterium]|nr:CPBP family intramembrane metalloprotease [Defluviitaleaceae bacterium]